MRQLLTPRDITRPSSSVAASGDPTSETQPSFECFSAVTESREMYVIYNPNLPAGCEHKSRFECDVSISSGQNHIVKRLMKTVGIDVRTLRRIAIGPIRLPEADELPPAASCPDRAVPICVPERRRKRQRTNDSVSSSTPTPVPVLVAGEPMRQLLEQLDYENTLARLRRCDLVCRWRHSRCPRLGRWLRMTAEERANPCFHGFRRLKCHQEHPPPPDASPSPPLSPPRPPSPAADATDISGTTSRD
jgi:hypothetical protein